VEEELQSRGGVAVPPPVPPRRSPLPPTDDNDNDDDVADDDDKVMMAADDDDYLELQDEDLYEPGDAPPPPTRQCRVLPGQTSMPESSLPPALMPRKQSCPDTAIARPRTPKLLPQTPEEPAGKPPETARRKPIDRPPVADRKPPKRL